MTKKPRVAARRHRMMIYGATGFTGGLIAHAAREIDCDLLLAGRDRQRLERVAHALGTKMRAFSLDEPAKIADALVDVDILFNAAGPFPETADPLIDACLAKGAHYLDVAGELSVFAAACRRDAAARQRGIMIMPGAAFTVAATDCLAAALVKGFPHAKYLRFALARPSHLSRGSLRTLAQELRGQVAVRRCGRLTAIPAGSLERQFDFGSGEQTCAAISLADVFTAHLTTGIANIEAYVEAGAFVRAAGPIIGYLGDMFRPTHMQPLLRFGIDLWPQTRPPSNAAGHQKIVAEVEDSWRRVHRASLSTIDGYRFTAAVATLIIKRLLSGDWKPGFQTPGGIYGSDLILAIPGTTRQIAAMPTMS